MQTVHTILRKFLKNKERKTHWNHIIIHLLEQLLLLFLKPTVG